MAAYWEYTAEFTGKVEFEMVAAAIAVMAESVDTENHLQRVAYAKSILNGVINPKQWHYGFAANATIKAHLIADTDYTSDLAFVASSLFNAFAGVSL